MPTKRPYLTKRGRPRRDRVERGQGRLAIEGPEAKAICGRLARFIRDRFGSVYEFVRAFGLAHSTVQSWVSKANPRVPDSATLLSLAHETGISLDWLLLGEGSELRGASLSAGSLAVELRRTLIAELVARGGVSLGEATGALPGPQELFLAVLSYWRDRVSDFRRAVGQKLQVRKRKRPRRKGT